MSPVFITLHPDSGGVMRVNIADIVSVGPADGEAKGSRVTVRNDRVYDVKEDAKHVFDVMRRGGATFN